MRRILIGWIGCLFIVTGCQKAELDNLAFPSQRLDEYEFENYDAGNGAVPDEYAIAPADRTLIPLTSTDSETGEEYTIYGVYIGDMNTISTDTIILYGHGQSLHMDAYWPRVSLLSHITPEQHQYGVFMIDYRGYGMSEGEATERGLYEDMDAAIEWLKTQGAQAENTIYYGFSLGCIPLIERAAYKEDFKPAKLIIEAPLASVENLAQSSLIINVDPSFVSSLEFENAEVIKEVTCPLLWFHGEEDDYIAIQNGELVYANHQGTFKEAVRVPGAGHGNIPEIYGYEIYLEAVATFILE